MEITCKPIDYITAVSCFPKLWNLIEKEFKYLANKEKLKVLSLVIAASDVKESYVNT